jgi:hypothetical protein
MQGTEKHKGGNKSSIMDWNLRVESLQSDEYLISLEGEGKGENF